MLEFEKSVRKDFCQKMDLLKSDRSDLSDSSDLSNWLLLADDFQQLDVKYQCGVRADDAAGSVGAIR